MADKRNQVPVPHDRQTIWCLHCHQPMEVGMRMVSAVCRHCGKQLYFEDVRVERLEPKKRAVETYGNIVVEKKGNCWADRIFCRSLVVRGKVNGPVTSLGSVRVGPKAEVRGDVTAPSLAVDAGAILEGHYRIGQTGGGAAGEAK